jgi:cytochrome c-type biogenesis protein CcmF
MVSQIGSLILSLAGILSLFNFFLFVFYKRSNDQRYLQVIERSLLSQSFCIIFSNLCLLNELLVSNFNLQYVAQYSSYETPLFFKMTALWAGQAGSLLFWSSITSLYAIFFILCTLKKIPSIKNISFLMLNVILAFFLMLNNFIANPFEPVSSDIIVSNGNGLNPLLQNVTMAIHPPTLYFGFIGTTIIFVMAIAGLMSNELSNKWIYSIRKWSLFTWTFFNSRNNSWRILGL